MRPGEQCWSIHQGSVHPLPEHGVLFGHQDTGPADPSCCTRASLMLPSVASTSLPFMGVVAFLCALLRGHDPFLVALRV